MAETDKITGCGSVALSWIQMLASCIVGYHDIAGVLHYRINSLGAGDSCESLEDFLNCNLSHLDPERQLVENVFAVDDCSFLGLKTFVDTGHTASEYSECGEVPQTLIQMLARSIVNYSDTNRLNSITETAACTEITPLLTCITNAIESERLLVRNVFGLDNCDRMALKLFVNTSSYEDYNTQCTEDPESFMELLAQCIILYNGTYMLNTIVVEGYCDDLHAFWNCSNNHIDPERALVENVFATDDCGNLAIKWFSDLGEEGRDQ